MTEKPLHVRVAEALGWTEARCMGSRLSWEGQPPREGPGPWLLMENLPQPIPHYDTDWSATGPLIELYEISTVRCGVDYGDEDSEYRPETRWGAFREPESYMAGDTEDPLHTKLFYSYGECDMLDYPTHAGPTPLIAACNLILALKRSCRLETAKVVLADRHNLRP